MAKKGTFVPNAVELPFDVFAISFACILGHGIDCSTDFALSFFVDV